MQTNHAPRLLLLLSASLAVPACAQGPDPASASGPAAADPPVAATASAGQATSTAPGASATLPLVLVHKSPTCGCCGLWVEHMRKAGFPVEVRDTHALHGVKEQLGIPTGKASCHTAEIDGYVVEGHVPADDVKRLLAERPDARGLVLPGMPLGSPGMETPDGRTQPYAVELLARDGSTSTFATH